jgi:hypothetical protein
MYPLGMRFYILFEASVVMVDEAMKRRKRRKQREEGGGGGEKEEKGLFKQSDERGGRWARPRNAGIS